MTKQYTDNPELRLSYDAVIIADMPETRSAKHSAAGTNMAQCRRAEYVTK